MSTGIAAAHTERGKGQSWPCRLSRAYRGEGQGISHRLGTTGFSAFYVAMSCSLPGVHGCDRCGQMSGFGLPQEKFSLPPKSLSSSVYLGLLLGCLACLNPQDPCIGPAASTHAQGRDKYLSSVWAGRVLWDRPNGLGSSGEAGAVN